MQFVLSITYQEAIISGHQCVRFQHASGEADVTTCENSNFLLKQQDYEAHKALQSLFVIIS